MATDSPLATEDRTKEIALRFALLIGIQSFFADFTFEGSGSITEPYLAWLTELAAIPIFVWVWRMKKSN